MAEKSLTDYFQYQIWNYSDNTYQLNVNTDLPNLDLGEALSAADLVSRSLREDVMGSPVVFTIHVLDNGSTSTSWRDTDDLLTSTDRRMWANRRLHYAVHTSLIPGGVAMPPWAINLVTRFEMLVSWMCRQWLKITGRESYGYVSTARQGTGTQPAKSSLDELSTASEEAPEQPLGVVLPFVRPTK